MDNVQEKIAKRAFDLFVARGGQHGYHIQDWLQAEKEVGEKVAAPKKKIVASPVADAPVKIEKKAAAPKEKVAAKEKAAPVKKVAAKK